MRIALFTDTFAPQVNGVTMTLNRLLGYWEQKEIEYLVFAPDDPVEPAVAEQIRRVVSIPFPLYPAYRIPLSRYAKIEKQLLEFQPDLLHLATPFTLGLAGLRYGQRHQVPIVASYHTNFDQYLDYYRFPLLKKMFWNYMNWFHGQCERNYCPSLATKDVLEEKGIQNVEIWSRGIDRSLFSPAYRTPNFRVKHRIDPSKVILLYVGRVAPEKDFDILLESYQSLPAEVAEKTHLVVVGDGPLLEKLDKTQYPTITWTGFLKGRDLAEAYASSDIFVFPSSTETFGNVVLEAMASGLPVLGVEAGGVTDIVTHMKNGLLCYPRSVESFREGINLLVRNQHLRVQMAHFAKINATKRSWDTVFDKLTESYYTVIEQSNGTKARSVSGE